VAIIQNYIAISLPGFTPNPGNGETNGGSGGKSVKKNGHAKDEETTNGVKEQAPAKVERKKSDVKPTKEEESKPPVDPEAEKTGLGGAQKKPVPAARAKPGPAAAKTVPNTPTAPAKAAGTKEPAKPESSWGFLKRA